MSKRNLLSIGIDFGTTFSFCCYLEKGTIRSLIPVTETYGIPSLFYDDGKNKSYGKIAAKKLENPRTAKNVISSVKRRLSEDSWLLDTGNNRYAARDVIREIVNYMVQGAIKVATETYQIDFDDNFRVEAVVTVPVDFSEPQKKLIEEAISSIIMPNGTHLLVRKLLPEPVAAAIEYFGLRSKQEEDILVYDLGGGTFDAAWVHSNKDEKKIPYEVMDQGGDSRLGGDDWDAEIAKWLQEQYLRDNPGETITKHDEAYLRRFARDLKEELSEETSTSWDLELHGNVAEGELTREKFEQMTRHLLDRTLQEMNDIIKRRGGKKPDYIILTGGSSIMPQVMAGLKQKFPGVDIRSVDPAHAIANGAARYADWLQQTPVSAKQSKIQLISSHAYGIRYHYDDTDQWEIRIMIPRGAKLPYSSKTTSVTRNENQHESYFAVFELDSHKPEGTRVPENSGREIMSATLKRPPERYVPKGTQSEETLTLSESELLAIEAVDQVGRERVKNSVALQRKQH